MRFVQVDDFAQWRSTARQLLVEQTVPNAVRFSESSEQATLFSQQSPEPIPAGSSDPKPRLRIPRQFLTLAEAAGYHRNPQRWNLLYRMLWRITHGEPQLLEIETDDDVLLLKKLEKEVRRDAHKMKAFVRFRKVTRDGTEHYIAWHRPDHRIVRKVAPFFSRRFKAMNWTILTPDESVVWDQRQLTYGDGVPRSEAPDADALEELWRTYYASIFNPARVKVKMMKSEMPVRHWATLPEAEIIPDLLAEAPRRVEKMLQEHEGFSQTASHYLEDTQPRSISELAQLASNCQACDLHTHATQTVFGIGPTDAKMVIVGEQPGDQEDRTGRPFIGPAGQILDEAFRACHIERDSVYLTNVVKHFKYTMGGGVTGSGKRRLHQRPDAREVRCCLPWFQAEWEMLHEAQLLVCLGATAANAIIGPEFKLTRDRGRVIPSQYCRYTIATWHPSAILRTPAGISHEAKMNQLIADLDLARQMLLED